MKSLEDKKTHLKRMKGVQNEMSNDYMSHRVLPNQSEAKKKYISKDSALI
jgi:hypothetical protein